MDFEGVKTGMPTLVPMVGTLSLEFLKLDETTAVVRLPDQPEYHNHIGGPHAGAMFTLGESASGALGAGQFRRSSGARDTTGGRGQHRLQEGGDGAGRGNGGADQAGAEILAEVESGTRPEFRVDITIATDEGTVTGQMYVVWTLKLNK